ncbi:CPBP family intramembrane glutamic endopeptidase [Corynebacterium liangguodongii]|uniref:CPBP family intramembrane metalloprotease n=1 Tax=Corynebacterium liangguodongii TaxID=2079535 RepID=A0A2S0WGG5_9CORY|nr:CPBP family intramembrane glutamic endopeptidase [Corynebacterium liangguodongii]AWB84860.1 CPBP family intramembrane metalloprotease [Corynebacterium liangguodongii]PWB99217.1 CPBP family intramembrane metalloprotease [Corynebacterium liangguodongii]
MSTRPARIRLEILIVLAVTFGLSGVRSILKLIDAYVAAPALNLQKVTLNGTASTISWLDLALQVCSAASLLSWGALALYLLGERLPHPRGRDWLWGAGLAALIGIPGLALYVTAVHMGWSKEVVPATETTQVPTLLIWSFANAFAEETVVVTWFVVRLRQLGWHPAAAIASSAVLRGSYHLYQGVSAGFGNIVMGVVFASFFHRTGKIWPLILAHFLIDAVAYLGYLALDLSWLGIKPG